MIILSLESSTKNCAVGLIGEDGLIDSISAYNESYSHAEKLHVFIDELLGRNKLRPSDLDAVAVNKGPGSYTGLRIGVSAAKGLCYSLNIPLVALDSLAVLCAEAMDSYPGYKNYIPMIDARRMEVYTANFDAKGRMVGEIAASIIDEKSLLAFKGKKTLLFGDGAEKCRDVLEGHGFDIVSDLHPGCPGMVLGAVTKYNAQDFEDVAYFEPFYLKDFIAGKSKDMLKAAGS